MFSPKIHRNIFLFGLFSFAFCTMVGKAPASVAQAIMFANWLLEGNFRIKWQKLRRGLMPWLPVSVFVLQLIGLTYSTDIGWGLNALRVGMPLVAIPLVLYSTDPLTGKELRRALCFFIAGCVFNTAWCLVYANVLHTGEAVRDASRFMSHIRLGMFVNMAIACCVYLFPGSKSRIERLIFAALGIYFVVVLFALGLASGLSNFFIVLFLALLVFIYRQKPVYKVAGISALIVLFAVTGSYLRQVGSEQLSSPDPAYNRLMRANSFGRPLIHFDSLGQKENGNYVLINIQLEDIKKTWNKRVPQDSFSYKPEKNLETYYTLLRYLASRGYTKDREGVMALNEADISNIRKGVVNYLYPDWSFTHKRLYELVNEYDDFVHNRGVNGHSMGLRLYYWRAALAVIAAHPLAGVGTGDTQAELNKVYRRDFPVLEEAWYKRPHNQFLSMAVCFGLPGFLVLMLLLFYPALSHRKYFLPLYWVFFVVLCLSFITEDTLETQAGMAFYIFFGCILGADAWFKKQQTPGG